MSGLLFPPNATPLQILSHLRSLLGSAPAETISLSLEAQGYRMALRPSLLPDGEACFAASVARLDGWEYSIKGNTTEGTLRGLERLLLSQQAQMPAPPREPIAKVIDLSRAEIEKAISGGKTQHRKPLILGGSRWNVDPSIQAFCRGEHPKSDDCHWERIDLGYEEGDLVRFRDMSEHFLSSLFRVNHVALALVKDATEEDAKREGFDLFEEEAGKTPAREFFILDWTQKYGVPSWSRNDWTVVIQFERVV